ncbi:MAG: tRNA pseudouridine(38-40) synthase TruA [Clostridiales bacterium]|nr:tRNA pseudouridine(38-40) synthase TruA [Clostridiales bacterium]
MSRTNFKMKIEYNGSNFFGWQKQNGKRTVQGELENAFLVLTQQEVSVEGSGRTDKGVHSLGQVASVEFDNKMPVKKIKQALNNLLPKDIVVKSITKVPFDFHARFSAKKKTYRYTVQIKGDRSALNFDRIAYYPYEVDLDKIKKISKKLEGVHNFKGFCSSATSTNNFEREIYFIKIKKVGNNLIFEVCGNGFLYNMVRIIVGTLLEVGRNKLTEEDVERALQNGDRKFSGKTMPACGLCLMKVEYK